MPDGMKYKGIYLKGQKHKGEFIMKTAIATIFLVLAVINPAFAAGTVVVYKSGILVSLFVGVCALVVVSQLVPALMLIMGFIKELVASKPAATESTH